MGPMNTVNAKDTIAMPKDFPTNISAFRGPASVKGPAPKNPPNHLQTRIEVRSLDTAVPNENAVKPKVEMMKGRYRPFNSENGAQTTGPIAKPSTYRDTPSVTTSRSTPWIRTSEGMAVAKMALANVTTMVEKVVSAVIHTLIECQYTLRKMYL